MAGIRGRSTRPEMLVRRFLHRAGLRYRLHDPNLPGRPDMVFPKHRAVVEVRGCFWHQHAGCRFAYTPKSNTDFWTSKLAENVARDRRNETKLRALGWRVLVVWECEIHKPGTLTRILGRITSAGHRRRAALPARVR